MPSATADGPLQSTAPSPYTQPIRKSNDKSIGGVFTLMNGSAGSDDARVDQKSDPILVNLKNSSLHSLANGRVSESIYSRDRSHSKTSSTPSLASGNARMFGNGQRNSESADGPSKSSIGDSGAQTNGVLPEPSRPPEHILKVITNGDHTKVSASDPAAIDMATGGTAFQSLSAPDTARSDSPEFFNPIHSQTSSPTQSPLHNRFSSPPRISAGTSETRASLPPLSHRHTLQHTLQVPKLSNHRHRDFSFSGNGSEDVLSTGGRGSPTVTGHRRASLGQGRRATRSIHSDLHLDEVPQDEDAARWTEAIRQKRASRRRRKEEEDEDRVIVGTKVDQGHVNWVTAYNMLTGIRFTVSRTNAKMDRELTDADFVARHKFSFDITGNELTPSAKYDFKFKDYAPWVFRRLRAKFGLDPADYLMSLTSKYILSELGSPGKSGSFFYFSRDYKYIIKTIHHAEHKLLRKVLRDYYYHVQDNPNTLISQFYGLHRVKIPYGKKTHFVVMNNLFPPHRDIHQTFDLKGSTIGRDFKEEDLARNPRATMKDLNWLRRNNHLEFGPQKKDIFIEQMRRDVQLLQKLKIMDYSLLVGIHDVGKGNEENVRDKTLRVFQPGGERGDDDLPNMLTRTPSKLENAKKARELRQTLKKEKPVPMGLVSSKMPDEMLDDRKDRIFYSDDGGFRATHETGQPGEEIYYLGIIDCLTHYGVVKKLEHFWKGMSHNRTQISPIAAEGYGDRFINFITAITMSKEEAERHQASHEQADAHGGGSMDVHRTSSGIPRSPADRTLEKAEHQARKTQRRGANEGDVPDRAMRAVRSASADRTSGMAGNTLPVVEEAGEAGSTGGRSGRSGQNSASNSYRDEKGRGRSPASFLPPNDTDIGGGLLGIPYLQPATSSPAPMDPEKSVVDRSPRRSPARLPSPARGYTYPG